MEYWFTLGTLDTGDEVSSNCPRLVPYRTVNVSFLVSGREVKDHVMVTVLSVELESTTSGRRGKLSSVTGVTVISVILQVYNTLPPTAMVIWSDSAVKFPSTTLQKY